jgi:hypothetical protein
MNLVTEVTGGMQPSHVEFVLNTLPLPEKRGGSYEYI